MVVWGNSKILSILALSQNLHPCAEQLEQVHFSLHISCNTASIVQSNYKYQHPLVHGLWKSHALIRDKDLKHTLVESMDIHGESWVYNMKIDPCCRRISKNWIPGMYSVGDWLEPALVLDMVFPSCFAIAWNSIVTLEVFWKISAGDYLLLTFVMLQ